MAATEYLGVTSGAPGGPASLEGLGRPGEAARRMAERLDGAPEAVEPTTGPGVDGTAGNSDNSTRD
jgi:hypothetical protein